MEMLDEKQKALIKEIKKVFTAYLGRKKLRKTFERFAILEEVYLKGGHMDVDSLYIAMKNKKYRVSRATVYNTLDILVDCGLVTRHQFGQNLAQYERAYGYKQHDHAICINCQRVFEFCDPRIQNIQDMVTETLGFKVLHHSLLFYGECQLPDCEEAALKGPEREELIEDDDEDYF